MKLLIIILNLFLICRIKCTSSVLKSNSSDDLSIIVQHNNSMKNKLNDSHIDCFGFGKTVSQILEWYFKKNSESLNYLDVKFYLTSSKFTHRNLVIVGDQFGLDWTDFKIQRKTIIIVHGFLTNHDEKWISEMENAFLKWDDVNVVVVDWSAHGNTWNYYKAVVNAKTVSQEIVKFLSHVVNATLESGINNSIEWGPIHMVGHSLGAHICGITSNKFKKLNTKWQIKRITGLDPAQPCFKNSDILLDQSDAPFVDVIHTNGKLWSSFGLGLPDPVGHQDYYPNGGRSQPGCLTIQNSWVNLIIGIPKNAIEQAICSHGRSYLYLTDSIISATLNKQNCTFWGHTWDRSYRQAFNIINKLNYSADNKIEMGIHADKYSLRGTFFVMTSNAEPFCDITANNNDDYLTQLKKDFPNEIDD
ncbi:pancreatic triacylglycerol lipase-like [Aphidius gifuensis]|uniref:pancreatic triacylglycerol lipase-like n=1 Tax=Aphidius gifuensis TaxID=684658 RepID=UPI001CDC8059|nr:pancreatic triacylglycerol lipase-like [Aphidius gifuensis]